MNESASHPTNKYVRDVLRPPEPPPPIPARFFYTSPFVIDDPLSPLPPPQQQQQQQQQQPPKVNQANKVTSRNEGNATTGPRPVVQTQQPPRPFSAFDNGVLEQAWLSLRKRKLVSWERRGESSGNDSEEKRADGHFSGHKEDAEAEAGIPIRQAQHQAATGQGGNSLGSSGSYGKQRGNSIVKDHGFSSPASRRESFGSPRRPFTAATAAAAAENTVSLTGTPFIRAPSRRQQPNFSSLSARLDAEPPSRNDGPSTGISRPRPSSQILSSFNEENGLAPPGSADRGLGRNVNGGRADHMDERDEQLTEKVPVGVSRLHQVIMPHLQ